MPLVLLAALAGSLVLHAAALFGPDIAVFDDSPEAVPLRAELRPPPAPASQASSPPSVADRPPAAAKRRAATARPAAARPSLPEPASLPLETEAAQVEPAVEAQAEIPETLASAPTAAPLPPSEPPLPTPLLPAEGVIRYAIYHEGLGLPVGRAEHRWQFAADGAYTLRGVTETSGLVALFKPVRVEHESRGQLMAGGLRPERFRTLRNGRETTENADFDWSTGVVHLARDGSTRPLAAGAQDVLSLNYQLAYLPRLEGGRRVGVVTGKKYESYELDALGEAEIELPAGRFRTLHLRAMTDSVTEIWIALDQNRLPVKIRFTDRKGERFVQLATELGRE